MKPASTKPNDTKLNIKSLAQTCQYLKISANQKINNESSIPDVLNIKEKIGMMGIMWPRMYATRHLTKYLLQSFSTEGYTVNCGP